MAEQWFQLWQCACCYDGSFYCVHFWRLACVSASSLWATVYTFWGLKEYRCDYFWMCWKIIVSQSQRLVCDEGAACCSGLELPSLLLLLTSYLGHRVWLETSGFGKVQFVMLFKCRCIGELELVSGLSPPTILWGKLDWVCVSVQVHPVILRLEMVRMEFDWPLLT